MSNSRVHEFRSIYGKLYDERGVNVFDPADTLGYKTFYIHLIQEIAIKQTLKSSKSARILDFACGAGRFEPLLAEMCESVTGVDIDRSLLKIARSRCSRPNVQYVHIEELSALTEKQKFDVIFCAAAFNNRAIGKMIPGIIQSFHDMLASRGRVIILEKIVAKSGDIYFSPGDLIEVFNKGGFNCVSRRAIRKGHRFITYLIRYGLVRSESSLRMIAEREIERCRKVDCPSGDYYNYVFVFDEQKNA